MPDHQHANFYAKQIPIYSVTLPHKQGHAEEAKREKNTQPCIPKNAKLQPSHKPSQEDLILPDEKNCGLLGCLLYISMQKIMIF